MQPPSGAPDKLDSWLLLLPHCLGGGRGRPLPLASGRPRALEAELGKRGSPKRPMEGWGGGVGRVLDFGHQGNSAFFILFYFFPSPRLGPPGCQARSSNEKELYGGPASSGGGSCLGVCRTLPHYWDRTSVKAYWIVLIS